MKCIERRLAAAILASVLLHALVLVYLRPVWEESRRGDRQGIINASLLALPTPRFDSNISAATIAALAIKPKDSPAAPSTTLKKEAAARQSGTPVNPTAKPQGRRLSALLVIDASGQVGFIHWSQLPAMTHESFQRLENSLRQKAYPAIGVEYTVLEPLDAMLEQEALH